MTKLANLDQLKKGESQSRLTSEYAIGKSTIGDIKKNKGKINCFAATMDSLTMSTNECKVMQIADDDKLDEALFLWFMHKRSQSLLVSGPVLCERAMEKHVQIQVGESMPPFQASRGWLWHFCNRHGIRQLSLQGEKLSSGASEVKPLRSSCSNLWRQRTLH